MRRELRSVKKPRSGHCRVDFIKGNIVDHKADGLISTGNVFLNMSGGVNGELLSRGGIHMQKELHACLSRQQWSYVDPGFTMVVGPDPFDFKCIVYTVAVDAFYESSIELVCQCLQKSFALLLQRGCNSVALAALATGYGRLSRQDFGCALRQFIDAGGGRDFDCIDVVCERNVDDVKAGFYGVTPARPLSRV